jgi:hypothetical protein
MIPKMDELFSPKAQRLSGEWGRGVLAISKRLFQEIGRKRTMCSEILEAK